MAARGASDAAIRAVSLAVTVTGLYGLRSGIWFVAWLTRRSTSAVWGHCLWDPTWLGSLFNSGVLYCEHTFPPLEALRCLVSWLGHPYRHHCKCALFPREAGWGMPEWMG